MTSFFIALNAVVPFVCYMAFGYLVRRLGLVDQAFMKRLNQMIYRALYPILLFSNFYNKDSGTILNPRLVIVSVASIFILIGISFLIIPRLVTSDARRGVLIQGLYRSNFVLFALPLTENLFANEGTTVASMMIAIVIPIYNIMAIVILEYYRGGRIGLLPLLKKVLSNPMIEGAIVGFVFVILGIHLPQCIEKPVSQFSNMTTPLALFVLGGTLTFTSMRANLKYLIPTLSVKLIAVPALALLVAKAMAFTPVELFVYFTMFGTPIAAASYPMASNMGGDGELAGELVALSTTLSVFTIFLWILVMKSIGLI